MKRTLYGHPFLFSKLADYNLTKEVRKKQKGKK